MPNTSQIKLPIQTLNWSKIKNTVNLKKIVLQFEIKAARNGNKNFQLVAYPFYINKKSNNYGKKVSLDIKKPGKSISLKLPLTLGNIELLHSEMKRRFSFKRNMKLEFTPHLYRENPHAEYLVSDGTNTMIANPSPPAKPGGSN